MDIDTLWLTEVPTEAFVQWLDMGFFDAKGLGMGMFYQLVKQTCVLDKNEVTPSERCKVLKELAKTMDKERDAVELSKKNRKPYDPFA
jgi:hypothetical protein